MLKGAGLRRKNEWFHTAQISAAAENIVHGVEALFGGKNIKWADPEQYMPAMYRERSVVDTYAENKRRWERALWQMKNMIDVRNERRAKEGLPPLPYKTL